MDIDYLILLQNFREGVLGGTFNDSATWLSDFIVGPIPIMLAALVYWLCDKRAGTFFFMNYGISKITNEIVKLFACVYRPWIKDDRVLPAGNAKTMATGYSFPSGHSNFAVSVYGSFAAWQWKKRKWLSIIAVIVCLITLFSRNFLGVHTPQDVIFGCILSFTMLVIDYQIFKRFVENSKHPWRVLVAVIAYVVIIGLIVRFKPYTIDYVDGKMLVDPDKMIPDVYCAGGLCVGWAFGWFLDKKFINYKMPKVNWKWIVLSIILVIPIYFWQKFGATPLLALSDQVVWINIVKFSFYSIEIFYVIAIIPAIFKMLMKKGIFK